MTNREFYTAIINGNVTDEIVEFARASIVKLDNKNSARKDKSAEKKATVDEPLKTAIYNAMEEGTTYTSAVVASEFGIVIDEKPITTSKASVLLKALVTDGKVVETPEPVKVIGGKGRKVKGYVKVV